MKIVFFGTPDFAVESLDAIMQSHHHVCAVVTVPDRQAGRGQKVVFSPVKQYALDHNLSLLQPEKLRDEDFLKQLSSYQADMFVVVAFRMLPEAVWNMPPYGTFNLHASLLPRYRGAAPINYAIINGDTETGVTTFLLNHHIDEGQILLQERTLISPEDNAGTLHDRLAIMGRTLVVRTLDGIESDTIKPVPQQGTPTAAPKIYKDDCRLHPGLTCRKAADLVRGLSPYPAALLTLISPEGEEVLFKVFDAVALPDLSAIPGALICDQKKVLKIGMADGFLQVLSLQMSGKRKNDIENFLRGKNITNWKLAI